MFCYILAKYGCIDSLSLHSVMVLLGFVISYRKFDLALLSSIAWYPRPQCVVESSQSYTTLKVKDELYNIYLAEAKKSIYQTFDHCIEKYTVKYPREMNCLQKDKDAILASYDLPAEHLSHIRTTNHIELVFTTVRFRTNNIKNCGS